MKGTVLEYNIATATGVISAEDGNRYNFIGVEYKGSLQAIRSNIEVDFQINEEGKAVGLYPMGKQVSNTDKSKIVAGLLALFLGGFGIHKFYLGYTKPGIIMVLCGTIGWVIVIPGAINLIIAFIEAITYLTKDDVEFESTYITNEKAWF